MEALVEPAVTASPAVAATPLHVCTGAGPDLQVLLPVDGRAARLVQLRGRRRRRNARRPLPQRAGGVLEQGVRWRGRRLRLS